MISAARRRLFSWCHPEYTLAFDRFPFKLLGLASFINMILEGFVICRNYSVLKWSAVYIGKY